MVVTCDNCNSKIKLVVDTVVNHTGNKYKGGDGSYSLKIKAKCDCTSEKPYPTELDSIEFGGNPPKSWHS